MATATKRRVASRASGRGTGRGAGGGAGRSAPGGRSLVAIALVGFVLVTMGVIARRVVGLRQERAMQTLERQRDALDAQRVRLEGAIRTGSSREVLQPIAEQRLHMHIPTPGQEVTLTPIPHVRTDSIDGAPRRPRGRP